MEYLNTPNLLYQIFCTNRIMDHWSSISELVTVDEKDNDDDHSNHLKSRPSNSTEWRIAATKEKDKNLGPL